MIGLERALRCKPVGELEARRRPVGHGHGDRPVQLHHGRGREARQLIVERGDVHPVRVCRGRGARVTGGDRRLQEVRSTRLTERLAARQRQQSAMNEQPVPDCAVLLHEQHRLAVRPGARADAGRLDFHQRHESVNFRLARREPGEDAPDAQRLLAQPRPHPVLARGGGIALVEHQVDDFEHRGQPSGELAAPRDLEGHVRVAERAFGAHDALRDGGLGDQEGARDFFRGQSRQQPQRERGSCFGGQQRMAGDEHQPQQIIADLVVRARLELAAVAPLFHLELVTECLMLAREHALAPQMIDGTMLGGGHEPGAGIVGDT